MVKVRARKPLYGEAMVTYSTKLRRDQVACLRKISNAAELMRAWVERGLAEEHAEGAGSFLLARKITALEAEIAKLQSGYGYVRTRDIKEKGLDYYSNVAKLLGTEDYHLEAKDRDLVLYKGREREIELLSDYPRTYCPGWTSGSLRDYLRDHEFPSYKIDEGIYIPKELALAIVKEMIEAYPVEVKAFEGYEAEIAKLDTELQRLRQKASGQP